MATLRDIRRRIGSVRNTKQITRAMKVVAASRLRRSQERIFNARPYANQMMALLESLAARLEQQQHPLLARRTERKVLLIVVTADRGLCGAFNANLLRTSQNYIHECGADKVSLMAVGRKGRDYFRKRPVNIMAEYVNIFRQLEFSHAKALAERIIELYTSEKVDAVDFVYNEFKSMMAQNVKVERYLPIEPRIAAGGEYYSEYIFEQPPAEILEALLPRYVEVQVFRALLESQAAENAARMTAMDSATNNADDLIEALRLKLNRLRQAGITKEIIEVVSGAQALEY
ncbi:MAG: ATP synthase F1 subunit gamma [Acidobacteria bacterium]|nr:MAG: ATP synthase F1 subunit gamma [Acidobacteriota bacterium]